MRKTVLMMIASLVFVPLAYSASVTTQYTQKIVTIDDGKGPKTYKVIEYSGPKKLSDSEIKSLGADMEKRQQEMDKMMERMMRSFWDEGFGFPHIEHVNNMPKMAPKVAEKQEKRSDRAWWETQAKRNQINTPVESH